MIASIIARVLNKAGLINRYRRKDLIPVSRFNCSLRIKLNGKIFKVPVLNKTGWENLFLTGGWFTGLLKELKINKDWTVIDVGANIGQTLIKIKSIDKEINYLGFEPNPVCINYLYKFIDRNNLKNTIVFPAGISDKSQLLTFYYYNDSDSDPAASIIPGYCTDSSIWKKNFVPVFNINEVTDVTAIPRIHLIKIDVEGAELEVLSSCKEIIMKHRPFIIIEILPVYTSENVLRRERLEKTEALIRQLNYKILLIKKGRNESFMGLEEKDAIGIHGNILNIDYLLAPQESNY